jgi:hypothetical protein
LRDLKLGKLMLPPSWIAPPCSPPSTNRHIPTPMADLLTKPRQWAWPARSKAPVGHGAELQEGMEQAPGGEQALGGYREKQRSRRRGGALTQRPGDTTVAWRGSARTAMMASSQGKSPTIHRRSTQLTKPRSHCGQGIAAREKARGRHGQGPELRRRRGCERPGGNRSDLADRRNRRRLIYRLSIISAAETGGARRNRARQRRGDAVARGSVREKTTRASEGGKTTGWADRATSRVRPVGWRRQVGLAR